jgi:hypothetical protein
MANKRRPRGPAEPAPEPSAELQRILDELASPDAQTRADAVRQLCPCRGTRWEVPVFPQVLALRNDPSPVVRHAVKHDLSENKEWGERQELRRMEGWRNRQEARQVKGEIAASAAEDAVPAEHSLAWRTPRRPRSRKRYYTPPGRRE